MPDQVTIVGLTELKARLRDPEMIDAALRVFGSRAVRTGKKTAVKAIDGGTGEATKSIVAKFQRQEGVIFVKSMIPYRRALSIEEGRRPGDPPPLFAVINWKEGRGISVPARTLQQQIARRGAKAKGFLAAVVERWTESIPRWLDEAATRIEKRFNKK